MCVRAQKQQSLRVFGGKGLFTTGREYAAFSLSAPSRALFASGKEASLRAIFPSLFVRKGRIRNILSDSLYCLTVCTLTALSGTFMPQDRLPHETPRKLKGLHDRQRSLSNRIPTCTSKKSYGKRNETRGRSQKERKVID